jgi:hypothetical protein
MFGCIAAVVLYFLLFRSEHRPKVPAPEPVAGWDELGSCSQTISLDGTKELFLDPQGQARIFDNAPLMKEGEPPLDRGGDGYWRLGPSGKQYAVTIAGETKNYFLVSPSENICVLIAGDVAAADLRASWFGSGQSTDDSYADSEYRDR